MMNIMTFNLRVHVPEDGKNAWPQRIHLAGGLIREAAPDIVGTQEAQNVMLADLDRELPGYSRIGSGRSGPQAKRPEFDECCAIYYRQDRLQLEKHGQFWLSETPDEPGSISWDSTFPRIVTWAVFQEKPGRPGLASANGALQTGSAQTAQKAQTAAAQAVPAAQAAQTVRPAAPEAEADAQAQAAKPPQRFCVFNTHFDHLGQQAREESARMLLERIEQCVEAEGLPVLMMGDLNSFPDNPAIAILESRLSNAYGQLAASPGCTFHEFLGGTKGEPIDYIFATPDVTFTETIVHREQREGAYPSDHYPIRAKVRFGL